MKKLMLASLLALGFTTGFTCSKNTPSESTAPAVETTPEAAPADAAPTEAAPTEGAPAEAGTGASH